MVPHRVSFALALLGNVTVTMAKRHAKNAVRLVLGRPRHPGRSDVVWAIAAHIIGLRRIDYVTQRRAQGEGAGSQALGMLMCRSLARGLGTAYAHQPFTGLDHNEGDPQDYARAWDDKLGLGVGEPGADQAKGNGLDIRDVYESDVYSRPIMLRLFAGFAAMVPDLRARYYRHGKHAPAPRLQVVMHVRRDEVTAESNSYLWTPMSEVRQTLDVISASLRKLAIDHDLTIVSLGERADFLELDGIDCDYALNEPALESFTRLVEADVLIMAKSCYSYIAALLCGGLVMYQDCVYPMQPTWQPLGQKLDVEQFEAKLRLIRQPQ